MTLPEKILIEIQHPNDGLLGRRECLYVPKKGEKIYHNRNLYVIDDVIHNMDSCRRVTLMVKEKSE